MTVVVAEASVASPSTAVDHSANEPTTADSPAADASGLLDGDVAPSESQTAVSSPEPDDSVINSECCATVLPSTDAKDMNSRSLSSTFEDILGFRTLDCVP